MRLLQRVLSSAEFAELWAEERIEPRGEWRADLRCGIQAAASAGPWARRRVRPSDYMPRFGPPPEQAPEEMIALVRGVALASGWKVVDGGGDR